MPREPAEEIRPDLRLGEHVDLGPERGRSRARCRRSSRAARARPHRCRQYRSRARGRCASWPRRRAAAPAGARGAARRAERPRASPRRTRCEARSRAGSRPPPRRIPDTSRGARALPDGAGAAARGTSAPPPAREPGCRANTSADAVGRPWPRGPQMNQPLALRSASSVSARSVSSSFARAASTVSSLASLSTRTGSPRAIATRVNGMGT